MKTTIWYEFTDKEDVQALRNAADMLEKNGYVKIMLPNVELDAAPIAGAGACGVSSSNLKGGCGGASAVSWPTGSAGAGGTSSGDAIGGTGKVIWGGAGGL
ncbi:hypothetical protein [Caballeronia sp. KNU42]